MRLLFFFKCIRMYCQMNFAVNFFLVLNRQEAFCPKKIDATPSGTHLISPELKTGLASTIATSTPVVCRIPAFLYSFLGTFLGRRSLNFVAKHVRMQGTVSTLRLSLFTLESDRQKSLCLCVAFKSPENAYCDPFVIQL